MKLRVGLVGLGDAWRVRHRPALLALADRYEIRAVCSQVAAQAEQVARDFNAVSVDGFRALANRPDVDAILVLGSQWYDPAPILAACEAGKAIYCAPAFDIVPERAREIKNRVEQSGIAFMAEFPRRVSPATLRLKELIATRLGAPRLLFCHHRLTVNPPNGHKHGSRRMAAGAREFLELVDWCRYVVGSDPVSVLSVKHSAGDQDDYQMMSLDFSALKENGAGPLAQISCGRYLPDAWREAIAFRPPAGLQVSCENGVAFIDLPAKLIWFDKAGEHVESLDTERPVGEQLLTHFHRAVTSLVRKSSDLEDAYRALQIVLMSQQSAAEGRRLPITF